MSSALDAEIIKQMVSFAINIAKENDFELDFSEQSIEHLDNLIDYHHEIYMTEEKHDEESYTGLSLSLGIYIGETLRKIEKRPKFEWFYGVPLAGGEATPYLANKDVEIFPIDWVTKYILNGSDDSVLAKFNYFKQLDL